MILFLGTSWPVKTAEEALLKEALLTSHQSACQPRGRSTILGRVKAPFGLTMLVLVQERGQSQGFNGGFGRVNTCSGFNMLFLV